MIDKYGTEQDPYCYPNSQVLKNLLDIKDENTLEKAERELTQIAIQNLAPVRSTKAWSTCTSCAALKETLS